MCQRPVAFLGAPAGSATAVLHRLWTSYSGVIPTIARCGRARPVRGRRPAGGPVAVRGRCRAGRRTGPAPGGGTAGASRPAGPGPPPAGPPAWPGCRGRGPRATRPAGRGRSGARPRRGWRCRRGSRPGRARRPGPGDRPVGQFADRLLVDLAQPARPASSSGAGRTSSSSCLTIEPIRSSLAGCSIDSGRLAVRCRPGGRPGTRRAGIGRRPDASARRRVSLRRRPPRACSGGPSVRVRVGWSASWHQMLPSSVRATRGTSSLVVGQRAVAAASRSRRCRPDR